MRINFCLFFSLVIYGGLYGMAPTNFFAPYDINLRMPRVDSKKWGIGVNTEYGHTRKGRNSGGNKTNVLNIYNDDESTIAMLLGFPSGSPIIQFLNSLGHGNAPLTDDGVRGHLKFSGFFEELDIVPWVRYKLPFESIGGKWNLLLFFPIKKMEIGDIKWEDLTEDLLGVDFYVKRKLTSQIFDLITNFSNLDLGNWNTTDIGDLACIIDWYKNFPQDKDILRRVAVHAYGGVSIPTGKQKDINKVFSLPLGNDGAWGFPLSLGLDLGFVGSVTFGINLEILILLDKEKDRLLKVSDKQTEFLLLEKGRATKSHGLTWKFNLSLQSGEWAGFQLYGAYQFLKHEDDSLSPKKDWYNQKILNSSKFLSEWTSHNFIFKLCYSGRFRKSFLTPQFAIFYKIPVNGKKVIQGDTFGLQVAVNF